jgi:hypothetical protein
MAEIIVFRSNETPVLNYTEIQTLLSELGSKQGLLVFERVLYEISDRLCQLELAIYEEDMQTVKRIANSLRILCPQIGLDCLAAIATEIMDVITCGSLNVVPAIGHRMVCLGEACLFQLAELPRVLSDQ